MAVIKQNKLIVVVSDSSEFLQQAEALFQSINPNDFDILICPFEKVFERTRELRPAAILIDLISSAHVTKVISLYPDASIFGSNSPNDAAQVVELVKAGVKNFLEYPFNEDEVRRHLDALRVPDGKAEIKKTAGMICLYGPKGGVGVTTIAVNLAVAMKKNSDKSIAILDLSPSCGDVATLLNVGGEYTIRDLVDNSHLLDQSFLKGAMVKTTSGVEILTAPREDQEAIGSENAPAFEMILELLRSMYDIVIIDVSRIDFFIMKKIVAIAGRIVVVGTQDVPCLKGLVSSFHHFSKMGYDPKHIDVVLNRYDSKYQMASVIQEFEKRTGQKVKWFLTSQYPLVSDAINRGCSIYELKPKTDLGNQIQKMAQQLMTELVVAPAKA